MGIENPPHRAFDGIMRGGGELADEGGDDRERGDETEDGEPNFKQLAGGGDAGGEEIFADAGFGIVFAFTSGGEETPGEGADPKCVPRGKDAGGLDEKWFLGGTGNEREGEGKSDDR